MLKNTCKHCGEKKFRRAAFCPTCGEAANPSPLYRSKFWPLIGASIASLLLAALVHGVTERPQPVNKVHPKSGWVHPKIDKNRAKTWIHPKAVKTPTTNNPQMMEIDRLLRVVGRDENSAMVQVHQKLEALLKRYPKFGYGLRLKANLYRTRQNYREALPLFRRYLELRPDDARGLESLGLTLMGVGDFKGAIDVFQQVVTSHPTYAGAIDNLSKAYKEAGDDSNASLYGEKARLLKLNGSSQKPPIVYLPKDPKAS